MKRLTRRVDGSLVFPSELVGVPITPDNEYMYALLQRLAAYEGTGLEPKDIVALTRHPDFAIADYYKSLGLTMERITELAQADREDGAE